MNTNKTIVIVIAIIVVATGGWYLLRGGGYDKSAEVTAPVNQTETPVTPTTSVAPNHDNIYLTKTDVTKGTYMTDFAGMTLYVFDKDAPDTSNCTGQCAQKWFFYTSGATAQGQFPTGITVFTRADGSKQFEWNNRPLYHYSGDATAGDIKGDGIGGVWHMVKF